MNRTPTFLSASISMPLRSSRWRGAQTFYFPRYPENERAAKFIQAELRRNLENTHRKARPIRNVYIMEHAKRPGVLVEAGFFQSAERAELKTSKYQNKVAASIYKGILRYFTSEKGAFRVGICCRLFLCLSAGYLALFFKKTAGTDRGQKHFPENTRP